TFVTSRCSDAILLAEANEPPKKVPTFFGEGDRMHMLFNFLLNQYMFLALAREDASTLREGFQLIPNIPADAHWLNFVRHHDELTLDQLGETERQEIFKVFAPEENMQIYDRGVRRRLPPMVDNDRRRLEMIYSLLFSLPGVPLLRYGEEIGMGDDLSLKGRDSVRTPMQWANEENGGFSTGSANQLARPMISSGKYGYQQVNVTDQQLDPNSLLSWIERAVRMRKQAMEFGWGQPELIETDQTCVFAHCCYYKDRAMLAVHNLSGNSCTATLKATHLDHFIDVFSDRTYDLISDHTITLSPYGYRWLKVKRHPQ
ncbi:MAG: alpha-glucosidase C-terminal domain-containing protein, partial [Cyanobacteria bacterium Co-bin13]|nr:alpha-glucosidase C-terminal domain-containing protein [Cyanobacteria bacterium Co-bin13]